MSELLREIRNFVLMHEDVVGPLEDLASEVLRLAQGGHMVKLALPDGKQVDVLPHDDHADVVERLKAVLPQAETHGDDTHATEEHGTAAMGANPLTAADPHADVRAAGEDGQTSHGSLIEAGPNMDAPAAEEAKPKKGKASAAGAEA